MAEAWDEYLEQNEARQLGELMEWLRIPSVSALPQHQPDVAEAAEWIADKLRRIGVPEVALLPTERNPIVFGYWHVDDNQPTALIYGHYDVQPPDPLALWETPPFDPDVRDGRLYARGASDDKGNTFMPVAALEALAASQGGPKINLKFFIEGEEEIGSPSLPTFMPEQAERLACDFVIAADGPMYGPDTPSLTLSSKGLAACQINLRSAAADMHSGQYGAAVPNAVQQLVQLASTFHTAHGKVNVEGFYDKVKPIGDEDRKRIALVPFDEEEYRQSVGAPALWGEPGHTALERAWLRPTLDFNGIWGGFEGEGTKTVTPAEAHLKITCRLVPDQDPEEILDLIERHVRQHCPKTALATVERFPGSSMPFAVDRNHPALQTAADVLEALYGKEPLEVRLGGTLPVAELFQKYLGAETIFYSFGMPGANQHAPNENFQIEASFRQGRRAYCRYLNALAR